MKKFKAMLYHETCKEGLIFDKKDLYDAAIDRGWSEVPIDHPENKPKEIKTLKKRGRKPLKKIEE